MWSSIWLWLSWTKWWRWIKIVVADEVVIEALVVDFAEADENQVAAVAVVAVVDVDFDVVIVGVVEDVGVEGPGMLYLWS